MLLFICWVYIFHSENHLETHFVAKFLNMNAEQRSQGHKSEVLKCDLEKPSTGGVTPSAIAAHPCLAQVLKFLQGAKCDLEKPSDAGFTPAYIAAENGHVEVLQLSQCAKRIPPAWVYGLGRHDQHFPA